MSKTKILCGGSAIAVAASLWASGAFAATAEASASSESTGATVGELVVVAEKREQSIETVPVAVTAFSAQQRVLMNIVKVQDLSDFSPGLSWTDVDDRLYIRGIGRNSDNLNNTSGVAIYYNGVYYGANAAIELQKDDLFIGNIEVDNGPQNTLHGSNADGGLIQFSSQRPTDTMYEEVRAEVDNYSEYRTEFVVSGPLDDHWKFRLGGNYSQMTGGYFNNLDGAPQGGNLVLGGGGQTHYLEGQIQGTWDKFDLWAMVSSGDFSANTKGDAVLGNVPFTEFTAADTLTPSDWYGLCGLPGVASVANGCQSSPGVASGGNIVPGSVRTAPYNGSMFPGGLAGNLNPRDFLDTMNTKNYQQENIQATTHLTWHADDFDVEYLGAYQQFHYVLAIADQFIGEVNAGVDSWQEQGPGETGNLLINPMTNYLAFDEFDQSFSHEIDITSTTKGPFQYVGGVYWYHERWNQPVEQGAEPVVAQPGIEAAAGPGQPQLQSPEFWTALGASCPAGSTAIFFGNLCPAPANPSGAYSAENTAVTYDSVAVFGQGSYKFNDQWKVSGALRYTSDHKAGYQTWRVISFDSILTSKELGAGTPGLDITALAAGPSLGNAFPGAGAATINSTYGWAQRTLGATWGAVTGEADVDWTPDPSLLVYGKYSRGYKSGGWSTYTLGPLPEVGPEFVDAFEMGVKKTVSSTLVANGDVFYYNYYGEQVPLTIVNNIGQLVPILYNVPLVHNYGVELWGTWKPTPELSINLSYSYLSAKVIKSACVQDTVDPDAILAGANTNCPAGSPAGSQNIVGQTIPGAAPNKIALNAIYTWSFDPGKLALSGSVIWKDNTYDSIFNRYYSLQPQYTQVNLLLAWSGANKHYNINVFCNNVFNTTGYDGAGGELLAHTATTEDIITQPLLTAPRTFGLQLQYRWQLDTPPPVPSRALARLGRRG